MKTLYWNDTTREARYAAITAAIAAGQTVYVATARGAIKVTPKTAAQWEASGRPLFKFSKGSIFIASGRRYDCVDFNHIQIAE